MYIQSISNYHAQLGWKSFAWYRSVDLVSSTDRCAYPKRGKVMNCWRFKGCTRCSGDLVKEADIWICFQCGRHYYPKDARPVEIPQEFNSHLSGGHGGGRKRRPCGGVAGRNINSLVLAQQTSDERWWANNREIIAYLEEGRPVREIAGLTDRAPRLIREVRQKLADRSVATTSLGSRESGKF